MKRLEKRWEGKSALGFTLIELLIVVAIIAILAAIAVPNFIEAQMRSKVSRALSDMRSIATALESYRVDHNAYPVKPNLDWRDGLNRFISLSTPIAYINSTDAPDPFVPSAQRKILPGQSLNNRTRLIFVNREFYRKEVDAPGFGRTSNGPGQYSDFPWLLLSFGPDLLRGPNPDGTDGLLSDYGRSTGEIPGLAVQDVRYTSMAYDSTNGTRSRGDIFRWP